LGLYCPDRFNPADFALEQVSLKRLQLPHEETVTAVACAVTKEDKDKEAVLEVCETRNVTPAGSLFVDEGNVTESQEATQSLLVKNDNLERVIEAWTRHVDEFGMRLPLDQNHKSFQRVVGSRSSFFCQLRMNC